MMCDFWIAKHHPQTHRNKVMPKNVNLKLFKNALVVLFAFAVLPATDVVYGQTGIGYVPVPGRLIRPGGTNGYIFENAYAAVECPAYPTVLDTSKLTFPVEGKLGSGFPCPIDAPDVRRYFHRQYLPAGYTGGDSVSMQQNCFGLATGWNLWLTQDGFSTVLSSDYTSHSYGSDLGGIVILEFPGHAVLAGSTKKKVNGEWEYRVVETIEKNGPSGMYKKYINLPFEADEAVSLEVMKGTATGFWKKKDTQ
jgi:hypothetical protein